MITVEPQFTYFEGFIMKGHADYDEAGKDIVCASASFLAQSIGQHVHQMVKSRFIAKPGYTELIIYAQDDSTNVLMNFFVTAMESLAAAYPDNIQFEFTQMSR